MLFKILMDISHVLRLYLYLELTLYKLAILICSPIVAAVTLI